jgi:hypothetical protein
VLRDAYTAPTSAFLARRGEKQTIAFPDPPDAIVPVVHSITSAQQGEEITNSESTRPCAVRLSSSICMWLSPTLQPPATAMVSLYVQFIPIPPLDILASFFIHSSSQGFPYRFGEYLAGPCL